MTSHPSRERINELHQFHELVLGHYPSSQAFYEALINVGREVLSMQRGILSRLHGQDYEVLECQLDNDDHTPGGHFTLDRTLPADVLESGGTVSMLAEPGLPGSITHPVFPGETLRAYIGAPVYVRERVFGTLDFLDGNDRERMFAEHEIEFLQLLARAAGQALERELLEQEREAVRRRMEEHVSLFEGAFNNAAFGMALVDMGYRTLRVNTALCRILGYSRGELLNTDFQTITHPDDLAADLDKVRQMLEGKADSYRLRKRFIHRDGSIVWALLAVSVVRDADGEPIHFIAQIEDITEQVHARNALLVRQKQLETANRRLEELARTDALTGLANRREFLTRMELELKRSERTGLPLSVMLIDVDHFKSYNDSFGHPEGDRALRVIAETLRDTCRDTDLVVRYGGEEFAALLPDTALEDAHGIAERMRAAVEGIPSLQRDMSTSIGVAATGHPNHRSHQDLDMEIAVVLEAADQALYRAKQAGRNQVKRAVGF